MEKLKVKILGIACNEVSDKETNWLIEYSLRAIQEFARRISQLVEIETNFIDLAGTNIRMCWGCDRRWELAASGRPWDTDGIPEGYKGCIIRNDWIGKEWWPKLSEAQGYIYGCRASNFCSSLKFKLFKERAEAAGAYYKWPEGTVNAPVGLITVGHAPLDGQESALINLTTTTKAGEMIPVSWMFGVCASDVPDSVKKDDHIKRMTVYSARRVAEAVIVNKLARQELGDLYLKQFIQMYHAPHPEGPWAWYRLDKEDEEYMMSL